MGVHVKILKGFPRLSMIGNNRILKPEVVQQTNEKVKLIQERMRTAQSRQKSYQDKRRKDLEFEVGDHVFLRVTPWTGLVEH